MPSNITLGLSGNRPPGFGSVPTNLSCTGKERKTSVLNLKDDDLRVADIGKGEIAM